LIWLARQVLVHAITLGVVLFSYRRPWRSTRRVTTLRANAVYINVANLRPAEHPLHQLAEQLHQLSRVELQHLVHRPGRLRKDQLIGTIVSLY